MKKRTEKERIIECIAKAMEKQYHKESCCICGPEDDGPDNCWKSMLSFAQVAYEAAASDLPEEKSAMSAQARSGK